MPVSMVIIYNPSNYSSVQSHMRASPHTHTHTHTHLRPLKQSHWMLSTANSRPNYYSMAILFFPAAELFVFDNVPESSVASITHQLCNKASSNFHSQQSLLAYTSQYSPIFSHNHSESLKVLVYIHLSLASRAG